MDFFKGFAVHADELPDAVFTAIGRTVWADIGPTAVIMRLVMKVDTLHNLCGLPLSYLLQTRTPAYVDFLSKHMDQVHAHVAVMPACTACAAQQACRALLSHAVMSAP